MEIDDCKPSTSSTIDGPCDNATSSSIRVEKKEEEDDDDSEFYFESEHLALKGNKDYLNLLKTISILEAQRVKAIEDYDKILSLQEDALRDPMKFVQKLQRGEDLGIPSSQVIAEVPNIDWSAYSMPVPCELSRPLTRKASTKTPEVSEQDVKDESDKSKVLVRGRIFDDSKPETFNQLWTAEEQRRLEELLIEYPPEEVETRRWRKIAAALGNRTTKQVCSRVQKYFIKLHKAGLPIPGRAPKMPEVSKRGHYYRSHFNSRSQRQSHYLYKHTTFFPQQDIPVYMSDFDDDAYGPCPPPNSEIDIKVEEDKEEDRLSDDDDDNNRNSVEYRQLALLRRVKRDKEREVGKKPFHNYGYKCDLCHEEPLVGTRWHCMDCTNISVDYCTDCVVTQMESSNPHPLTHRIIEVRRSEQIRGIWDQDYGIDTFSVQPDRYNYLDPNFMPE